MSKSIRFTASGSSSALGNFAPGDIARNIPDTMADHLVKEAMCAKYLTEGKAKPADPATSESAQVQAHAPAPARRPRKEAAAPAEQPTATNKDA